MGGGCGYIGESAASAGSTQRQMERSGLRIVYYGRVQGVGFRFTVKSLAAGFDVTGGVRNLPDGTVELTGQGQREELEAFRIAIQDSEVGRFITREEVTWGSPGELTRGFEILR